MTRTGTDVPNTHSRGYTVELREEEDGSWTALVPELPGAVAVGHSPNEAIHDLPEVIDLWIATARERRMPVPPPRAEPEVSGRFLLRLPKDLHHALVNRARVEGVSLNTYCVSVLSVALGESLAQRSRELQPEASPSSIANVYRALLATTGAGSLVIRPHEVDWSPDHAGLLTRGQGALHG